MASADSRARELANAYDQARTAGLRCAREYDGLGSGHARMKQ
ncbi:DUF2514 family protein [Pseudomonas monteilii]